MGMDSRVKARCSLLHTNIMLTVMRAAAVLAHRPPSRNVDTRVAP